MDTFLVFWRFLLQWCWRQLLLVKHLSGCCLFWVLLWRDPEGSDCDRDLQGPDCPSLTLLTCALLLSHSSYTRIKLRGSWHQLSHHLPSHDASLIATKMDIFLNDRAWRAEKKKRPSCRLILGVRPSLLEQASHKLEEFFRGNYLLVSSSLKKRTKF